MKALFFVVLFLVLNASQDLQEVNSLELSQWMNDKFVNNKCEIPPKPKKLAVWTMAKMKVDPQDPQFGKNLIIKFINHYAQMQCDIFDSIYIIWNNEFGPQYYNSTGNRQKWIKNVYFLHTEKNSVDHRFLTKQWMKQQVMLSFDDDGFIDCANIQKMYQQWSSQAVGQLGPLATNYARTILLNAGKDTFQYTYNVKSIYNIALPNLGIIPKHFMNLYYANIYQFKKIRQTAREIINCQDIALNFMANSFYPEFQTVRFENVKSQLVSSPGSTSSQGDHYSKRNRCAQQFSQTFGKNPISYLFSPDNFKQKEKRQKGYQKNVCLTYVKKIILEKKYFTRQPYYIGIKMVYAYSSDQQSKQIIQKQNEILSLPLEIKKKLIQQGKILTTFKSDYDFKDLLTFNAISTLKRGLQSENQQTQQLYKDIKMTILVVVPSLLIVICILMCIICRNKYRNLKITKLDSTKQNYTSVDLSSQSQRNQLHQMDQKISQPQKKVQLNQ